MIRNLKRILTSRCACAAFFPAVSLAVLMAASSARAGTMTYDVVSNPQPDIRNAGATVDVSGTMTVSNSAGSPIGTFDSTNDSTVDLDFDLTMTTTAAGVGPITVIGSTPLATAFSVVGSSQLITTPTSLSIGANTYFELSQSGQFTGDSYMDLKYDTHDNDYFGFAGFQPSAASTQFENFNSAQYVNAGEWTIATAVPEPSSILIFASAIAIGGVICIRRRGQKNAAVA